MGKNENLRDQELIANLIGNDEKTIGELMQLSKLSKERVQQALDDLIEDNEVQKNKVRQSTLYSLITENTDQWEIKRTKLWP